MCLATLGQSCSRGISSPKALCLEGQPLSPAVPEGILVTREVVATSIPGSEGAQTCPGGHRTLPRCPGGPQQSPSQHWFWCDHTCSSTPCVPQLTAAPSPVHLISPQGPPHVPLCPIPSHPIPLAGCPALCWSELVRTPVLSFHLLSAKVVLHCFAVKIKKQLEGKIHG